MRGEVEFTPQRARVACQLEGRRAVGVQLVSPSVIPNAPPPSPPSPSPPRFMRFTLPRCVLHLVQMYKQEHIDFMFKVGAGVRGCRFVGGIWLTPAWMHDTCMIQSGWLKIETPPPVPHTGVRCPSSRAPQSAPSCLHLPFGPYPSCIPHHCSYQLSLPISPFPALTSGVCKVGPVPHWHLPARLHPPLL